MAYNPFDDVIEQDPAYMAPGGAVRDIPLGQTPTETGFQPVGEVVQQPISNPFDPFMNFAGDVIAQTFGRIAENLYDPEAAKRGQKKFAIQQDAAKMLGKVPGQLTRDDKRFYEQRTGNKVERLDFVEGFNSPLELFLGEAVEGSKRIQAGERFTELPGNLQLGVAFVPFEFWLGGFGGRRAVQEFGGEVFNKYRGMSLGEIVTNPKAREEIPEVVASIEREYPILRKQTGPRRTTERPSDMDLVASQSDALNDRGLRFKTGMPTSINSAQNKARLENIQKLNTEQVSKLEKFYNDNEEKFLGKGIDFFVKEAKKQKIIPETYLGMTTTSGISGLVRVAPDLGKKVKDYQLPNYVLKEVDFTSEMSPQDQFIKKYSDSFIKITGRKPDRRELINHIIDIGSPQLKDIFSKSDSIGLGLIRSAKSDYIRTGATNNVIDTLTKNNPGFAGDLDIAKNNLKASDAKSITMKNEYEKLMKPFDLANQERPFSLNTFRAYISRQQDIPKRQKTLDLDTYEPPYASQKKSQRAYNRISKSLTSKFNDITGSLPRFLTAKYRSLMTQQGKNISDKDFMEKYVEPFVVYEDGSKKVNTEATLQKFRNEYENFPKWEKMENRVTRYNSILNDFMDRLAIDGQYDERQLKLIRSQLEPQRSHEFKISQMLKDMRFLNLSDNPDLIRIQPKVINVVYQPVYDNIIRKILNQFENVNDIAELKAAKTKALTIGKKNLENTDITVSPKDYQNQFDYLSALYKQVNENMNERGMTGLYDFNPKNKNIIKGLNFNLDGTLGELIKVGSTYNTPEDYFKRMDLILDKLGLEKMKGNNFYKYKEGGPVRMAIGGDPLQNINQQQFTPDPAIDDDYFQQAVDSGNLQAGLLSLFKVFGKPKSVATPSNVKKVEQARDPLPQAMPGEQQVAPLQGGKQDFYFKSFFLDQLNDPNAPKADYPQGWMNFLVKGKKVPNAEMLDTGITQYLEDTAQFFPNKKITREDLEAIYDSSPLGNLEVRVKNDAGRVNTVDDIPAGEDAVTFNRFTNDQGKAQHKNAGSAPLDNQAEDYFEVVINAPNLPGQEKAFIRSSHFEEPNTIGFTRVGTYKTADNEKVAVIQEMQTDMLTEVRKEQERLFAFVNNLKRKRERLVQELESSPDDIYYQNRLRQFDNAYPPGVLEGLAGDNLIKPFPNIVAKELIPEKTKSLDDIQKQINELAMANVEQYSDPAYKTKVFDLAQDQKTIVDQLMTMNRSTNYEEKMRDIKVPSTSDADELARIADTDRELPNYNMKNLDTFPPIPFNKQADYVDLLIKATVKAAKEKGINKVAIMPSEIGANMRWNKSSDNAKKKFQNLYDKVGVQQLKNIAKKYDGVFGEEAIIDSTQAPKGLKINSRGVDGRLFTTNTIRPANRESGAGLDKYIDSEIRDIAMDYEPNQVVLSREVAPGQTMEYFVNYNNSKNDFDLIPLGPEDNANNSLITIQEFNPQEVKMYTITFDPSKLEEPMYMFKKKDGGTIAKDSLVSITDIYGEYGR
tara:strand:+ start:31 stop:4569 length:4539 start_codon:yes stop_codon:yes gene_type:complete